MKVGILATAAFAFLIGFPVASMAGLSPDTDGDGEPDVLDNCSGFANEGPLPGVPENCDTDQDGIGNACDCDFTGSTTGLSDGVCDGGDFTLFLADFSPGGADTGNGTDMNCDGVVDGGDFALFIAMFGGTGVPGPSGLSCANHAAPFPDNSCPN